jgi:hypothetical protein
MILSISNKIEFLGANLPDIFKVEFIPPSKARIHLASNFCRGCFEMFLLLSLTLRIREFRYRTARKTGTYKPDGPTVSGSFGKDSYGLWQILVSSDEPVNQNTVILAYISVDIDERNVLLADIPALIIDWTSDFSATP